MAKKQSVYVRKKPTTTRKKSSKPRKKSGKKGGRPKSSGSYLSQPPGQPPVQPNQQPGPPGVMPQQPGEAFLTPSAPPDMSQPLHATVSIGRKKASKKKGPVGGPRTTKGGQGKRKLGLTGPSGSTPYIQRMGPVHMGYSSGNPLTDAENAVKAAMTKKGEGHTLDYRMKRLRTLQRAQMPDTFHANTPTVAPVPLNVPGQMITNPGAQGRDLYRRVVPGPNGFPATAMGPTDHSVPASGGPRQPHYPNNMEAAADEYAGTARALPGDTVWESRHDVQARHTAPTNEFLEKTLQNIEDERTREMGFNLLDSTEFEVVPSQDTGVLTLRNRQQPSKTIVLTENEFLTTVGFFADPAAPPLLSAPLTKTIEFFHVLTPIDQVVEAFQNDTTYMIGGFDGDDMADKFDQATKGMSQAQKQTFKDELGYQAMLDRYRDRMEPVRMVQRSRSWKELLTSMVTLGIKGQPAPATSVDSVVQAMSSATPMQREEAKRALEDMQSFGILQWDEQGTIMQPQTNPSEPSHAITGSNIFNLVNNVFSPNKGSTRSYLSHFKPIGEEFFVQAVMKAMSMRKDKLQPGISSLNNMIGVATGKDNHIMRSVEGQKWNLIEMARYFQPIGAFLGMTFPIWTSFLIHASDLTVSQFGRIMQYLAPLRENTRAEYVTGQMLETAGAVLDTLPTSARNTLNTAAFQYGGQFTSGAEEAAREVVTRTAATSMQTAYSYAASLAVGGASAVVGGVYGAMRAMGRGIMGRQ